MKDKFSFLAYFVAILKVAEFWNCDLGVAYDRFRTDVRFGHAIEYNTGDALPEFDFAGAKMKWDALSEEEKEAAYAEWHDIIRVMQTRLPK